MEKAKDQRLKKKFIFGVRNSSNRTNRMKSFAAAAIFICLPILGGNFLGYKSTSFNSPIKTVSAVKGADVLRKMNASANSIVIVNDIDRHLKINPEVKIDVSNMKLGLDDLRLVENLECQEAKDIMKSATKVRMDAGYCARHSKRVMAENGLFSHLPQERQDEIMYGLVSAYQFIDCFNRGEIKDFVEIHLDEEASKQKTMPFPICRVNETAKGAEDAHIQFMDNNGGYFGQRVPASPSGHVDERGIFNEYGDPHFYAHRNDVRTLISKLPGTVGVLDAKNNQLKVFREDEIPEAYRYLYEEHKKNNALLFSDTIEVDAVRVSLPELHPKLLENIDKDVQVKNTIEDSIKPLPSLAMASINKRRGLG